MQFSFWIGNSHTTDEILRRAQRAEAGGWDGVWLADHFMPMSGDVERPFHEAWAMLSAIAATTERVRIGPMVVGNTYRNPAVLAKQAVTADHISGGRVVLGMGAGWQENEHTAYGIEYGTFTDRFEKLEESLRILRGLRDDDRVDLDGKHYRMTDAPLSPKPVGRLPILIGGGGEKKTLRMVAQYAEQWNVWGEPDLLEQKIEVLAAHCERLGRDVGEIHKTAVALLFLTDTEEEAAAIRSGGLPRPSIVGTPAMVEDTVAAYAAVGVDELIIPDFTLGAGDEFDAVMARFEADVMAPSR